MPKSRRNILAVIIPSENDWRMVEGVARYNQSAGWRVRIAQSEAEAQRGIERWKPDGLICNAKLWGKIAHRPPTVSVFGQSAGCDVVEIDHAGVAEMAVDFFAEKGFRNFAFVTGRMRAVSSARWPVFERAAQQRGGRVWMIESGCETGLLPSVRTDEGIVRLGQWLKGLPRPLAVVALSDHYALHVTDACHGVGLSVPEEVAVLGVDDDPHVCRLTHPVLSSMRIPFETIGYEAAWLLDERLRQPRRKPQHLVFPPDGISERRSTDILAIADPAVVRALRFIGERRQQPIRASEVARASGISKTLLQSKFRETLGRTPLQEIHRQRIALAADLLRETGVTLDEAAERCGFSDAAQLSKLFKKITGQSPGAYRSGRSR